MSTAGPRTITAAADLIRRGELTPTELLEQYLARIDRYEPRVKAWVVVDRDGAREQAERLTAELKAGQNRGPLHGIPVGIKDIIDVFDLPTGCGSKLWANSVARRDATCVARLRQTGAVILGKTVTTAFAFLDPPPTRNPWNLDRTPGGSSSGSAAAVACGMCLAALGTQTGGSVTRPASYCGVCSLKPTWNLLSLNGVLPFAPSLDHLGVMANCVRDLAIVFQAIAGGEEDAGNVWATAPDAVFRIDRQLAAMESESYPRFGRLRGFFDELATPEMRAAMDRLEGRLQYDEPVKPLALPANFVGIHSAHRRVMAVEAAQYHASRLARRPDDYPPRIRGLVEEGLRYPAVEYADAKDHQRRAEDDARNLTGGNFATVLTPAATGPAPAPDTTGNPAMNAPWSFTGVPTVSMPIGWSADGLPLSAQLVGTERMEGLLLEAAAWVERRAGFEPRPVPLD